MRSTYAPAALLNSTDVSCAAPSLHDMSADLPQAFCLLGSLAIHIWHSRFCAAGDYTMQQEIAILHTLPNVQGALPLLARDPDAPPEVGVIWQIPVSIVRMHPTMLSL